MLTELNRLFDASFRIQREASEAAGRSIPLIVENVRGAQEWVGRARWNYGSFYLWGDVPALMPSKATLNRHKKTDDKKTIRHANKRDGHSHTRHLTNQREHDGVKNGNDWFGSGENCSLQRRAASRSHSRKFASAMIAKIPLQLSRHIAKTFKPKETTC